jgi:hypothetical protein
VLSFEDLLVLMVVLVVILDSKPDFKYLVCSLIICDLMAGCGVLETVRVLVSENDAKDWFYGDGMV